MTREEFLKLVDEVFSAPPNEELQSLICKGSFIQVGEPITEPIIFESKENGSNRSRA